MIPSFNRKNLETAGKGGFEHKHRLQAITPISTLAFRSGQIYRGIHICLLEPGVTLFFQLWAVTQNFCLGFGLPVTGQWALVLGIRQRWKQYQDVVQHTGSYSEVGWMSSSSAHCTSKSGAVNGHRAGIGAHCRSVNEALGNVHPFPVSFTSWEQNHLLGASQPPMPTVQFSTVHLCSAFF